MTISNTQYTEETGDSIRLALYEAFEYDEELILDACRDFLDERARLRDTVVRAAASADRQERHAGIHTVKGVLGMYGQTRAYAIVHEMNTLTRGADGGEGTVKALIPAFEAAYRSFSAEVRRLVIQLEASLGG